MTAALGGLRARVDRLRDGAELDRTARESGLVIVERSLVDGPAVVRGWLDADILDPTVPLLLFAPTPMESAEYRDWLAAGVWETVRLPIDPPILALRLRNLLGAQLDGHHLALASKRPYPWPTLVRATGETLALGRRYERPVACVAVAVSLPGNDEHASDEEREGARRLMSRLGVAAREWVRDSDLVGLTEQDVLLAVLPDTTGYYAGILGPRLLAAMERSLKRAGTVAALRSATRAAAMDGSESAADFLLGAVRQVT